MKSSEIRDRYIKYFKDRGHVEIPSASLLPENDSTTLFTGSGMQSLLSYLLGERHPAGHRIVNLQKCFRAEDINDIGDNRHTTYFEMMGNWSFGDYFKKEQLTWYFEFLTDIIGLDPNKLFVTVFSGDTKYGLPRDSESADIWKSLFEKKSVNSKIVLIGTENGNEVGMQNGRIFYYDSKNNWWSRTGIPENMPVGEPGGPDSELFYKSENIHTEAFGEFCHVNCDCGSYIEIGNSVFLEYKKEPSDTFSKLSQKNVDFGGGFERLTAVSENLNDIFLIDIFSSVIRYMENLSGKKYSDTNFTKSFRIIADHIRASVHLIKDGVTPSNTEQGYFLRRLIRRSVRHADILGLKSGGLGKISLKYGLLSENETTIIDSEENKFRKTLSAGLKEFKKLLLKNKEKKNISGRDAFLLFSSYGLPIDIITELIAQEPLDIKVDTDGFEEEFKRHQHLSRVGAKNKFKGGLADHSDKVIQYHTATHLLHQALRDVLGSSVEQKGSNITAERLRFDFSFENKLTKEQINKVESIINSKIESGLPVQSTVMTLDEAKKTGAAHYFKEKYDGRVKVYFIGQNINSAYSKEFCGGPHVNNTSELEGVFKIIKEESVSSGVRRIKAVLA